MARILLDPNGDQASRLTSVHTSALAFDTSGVPSQCEDTCEQADLEGFNACFDLVMSAPCRSRLCGKWYYNVMSRCLTCISEHQSGTEFRDIINVYNSTCHNISLVVSRPSRHARTLAKGAWPRGPTPGARS